MKALNRWYFIVNDGKDTDGMNNNETAKFHYYNPNGLYKKKAELGKRVTKLVQDNKAKSGCLLVHGGISNFLFDHISDMARSKRVNPHKLNAWIEMMKDEIRKTEHFLETFGG